MADLQVFDPVRLSLAENAWLLRHLGEPWVVAGRDIHPQTNPQASPKDKNPIIYPDGVIPTKVKPIIDRVDELNRLEQHEGTKWVGVEAVKTAIQVFLAQYKRWQEDKRRGAPRFPSLHSFDGRGRPHRGGPGSDSGKVSTYFAEDGSRVKFAIEFVPSNLGEWVAEWAVKAGQTADVPTDGLKVNDDLHRIECFCGHVEKFKENSRASFNAARSRISKHLRGDTNVDTLDRHREIHTAEFGGR